MASSLCYGNLSISLQSSCRMTDCLSPILCYNSSHVGFGSLHPNPCQTMSLSGQFMSSVISRHPWLPNSSRKKAGDSRLAEKGLVNAKLVRFSGKKQVAIPFQERSLPPSDYLRETERIVNVTFPDSARIKYIGDDVWQARLQSITFFNFAATPYCDVRVVHDNGTLYIDSKKLILDVTGLPDQFRNLDLQLSLHGELRVFPRARARARAAAPSNKSFGSSDSCWEFGGWVDLGVGVYLPLPLSLIPDGLLTGVGDQIVDRILRAMEGALLQGIIKDYNAWCLSTAPAPAPAPAPIRQAGA